MTNTRRPLGQVLLSHGVVSEAQLASALEYRTQKRCRLGEALLELKLCDDVDIARALAEQNDIPFVDFDQTPPKPDAIRLIPPPVATEYGIIPVRIDGSRLIVAARNPYDIRIDDIARKTARMPVIIAAAADTQLCDLLSRYDSLKHPPRPNLPPAGQGSGPGSISLAQRLVVATQPAAPPELVAASEKPEIVRKVNSLIAVAVRKRARSLFFEPEEDGIRVRCKIDGHLHTLTMLTEKEKEGVIARLKVMTGMPLAKVVNSATGSTQMRVDGRMLELRASAVASLKGEIVSFLVIDSQPEQVGLEALGFETPMLDEVRRTLLQRGGLVLLTGPLGAGKPTTLYAMLRHLDAAGRQVYALENTFERKLSHINQVQVNDQPVSTLALALTTCLNQNPDAVMVGELPDKESAEVACRAAATGQLILTGSLSPDAWRAMLRLLDLGLAPHVFSGALTAVIAQRLVRRVCKHCAQEFKLPFHLNRVLRSTFEWPEEVQFRKGKGCPECNGTGARGLIGVFEMIPVDEHLRYLIAERVPPNTILDHVVEKGYRSLEEDAFQKACRGVIPPDELVHLGLNVAAAMEQMTTADGSTEASLNDAPVDLWAVDLEAQQLPDPESWEEIASMAEFLTGDLDNL